MRAVLSFTIPTTFPGMNEIIDAARRNKYGSAAMKKSCTNAVLTCLPPEWERPQLAYGVKVTVEFRWFEKNQKRDPDNVIAAQKFILDALVAARVLDNDTQRQIGRLDHFVSVDRANPRVEVDVYEGVC